MNKLFSFSTLCAYIIGLLSISVLLNACSEVQKQTNPRNQYKNDMESYDGWISTDGLYNLKTGDAHSGQHSIQTDSLTVYSISFAKRVQDLSAQPIKKINISAWVKCLGTPASGSYVLSLERGNQTLKYFSFDLKEKDVIPNEWLQLKGTAAIPTGLAKEVIVKIYFWNKSKSVILVDDMDFTIEN